MKDGFIEFTIGALFGVGITITVVYGFLITPRYDPNAAVQYYLMCMQTAETLQNQTEVNYRDAAMHCRGFAERLAQQGDAHDKTD